MSDFLKRLKTAAHAAANEWKPSGYRIAGKQVACSHIEWFHDRPQKVDN